MNKTQIEWIKNPDSTQGYTWNPITGCLNGCEYCYARRLANTRLRERYLDNKNVAPLQPNWFHTFSDGYVDSRYDDPFYPRFWQSRLNEPLYGNPKGIFVCDMSDLFGMGIPEGWINEVFHTINRSPQHRFYLLTKQPQNLPQWNPFPDNCWVGVTATNTDMLISGLVRLDNVKAKIKYISLEPLLDRIPLTENAISGINWLIIGAQTRPYKPPKIEWVKEIVEAADRAGAKVFLKDNLKPLIIEHRGYTFPSLAYGETLRQEMPK